MKRLNPTTTHKGIMRKTTFTAAVGALLLTSSLTSVAQADNKRRTTPTRFTEYARVVDVQPVYQQIRVNEPRQECWTEYEKHVTGYEQLPGSRRYESARVNGNSGGAIVGGIIGGVIGNKLGRGSSKSSRAGATVAGAIIGSAIGNESGGSRSNNRRHRGNRGHHQRESRPIYETRPVERCKRVTETRYEERLQHYNVTYTYNGRTYTTQLPRDPGNRLELQVSVAPARY